MSALPGCLIIWKGLCTTIGLEWCKIGDILAKNSAKTHKKSAKSAFLTSILCIFWRLGAALRPDDQNRGNFLGIVQTQVEVSNTRQPQHKIRRFPARNNSARPRAASLQISLDAIPTYVLRRGSEIRPVQRFTGVERQFRIAARAVTQREILIRERRPAKELHCGCERDLGFREALIVFQNRVCPNPG